jgi:glycine/D-amino acid oxidase-like deaminating enzyme
MSGKLKVAVIGAGVIGAAIAYRLACTGAAVQVFEAEKGPGSGVSGKAFGWINLINGDPSNDAVFTLWQHGVEEYRVLESDLPAAFESARKGSLLWTGAPERTERLATEHSRAGGHAELIDHAKVKRLEPNLSVVPDCAIFSANDIALSPGYLARTLIERATSMGATFHAARTVEAIVTNGNRATGVIASGERHDADVVVVAAGAHTETITAPLGIKLGLETSPAVLLRYETDAPVVNRIVCCPAVEVRQANDFSVFCAIDYAGDGSAGSLEAAGEQELAALRGALTNVGNITFQGALLGNRPMFQDGRPRVGLAAGMDGLYIAVGHPGVILAPLIGKLAAQEIVTGERSSLLHG